MRTAGESDRRLRSERFVRRMNDGSFYYGVRARVPVRLDDDGRRLDCALGREEIRLLSLVEALLVFVTPCAERRPQLAGHDPERVYVLCREKHRRAFAWRARLQLRLARGAAQIGHGSEREGEEGVELRLRRPDRASGPAGHVESVMPLDVGGRHPAQREDRADGLLAVILRPHLGLCG